MLENGCSFGRRKESWSDARDCAGAWEQVLIYRFDAYSLDTARRELHREQTPVSLEPQVFDLLEYLIRNRDRVVSRDELFASIWAGRVVSESTLDTRLNQARSAIGDDGSAQRLIRTFPRKGFRFIETVREAEPEAPPAAPADIALLPNLPSIAVLPFTNMSGEAEECFADGIAEEIITALSRCRGLLVIARSSSFTYKGRTVDVRRIGQELGVRYVLEGGVRRDGERLRITGRLSDTATGANLWAERFEGNRKDVFDLQDHITASVVGAIEPKLQLAEIERLQRRAPANIDAYELLLRAQQHEYEFTRESLLAAIRLVERILAIDPSYAPAMALGAYCHAERRFQGWAVDVEAEAREGLRLARRALETGSDDANVLWMAAYAIRELEMDPRQSQELVARSLELNPSSAIALTIAAWNDVVLGDPAGARERLRRAGRLSPRDPRAWFMATAGALACIAEDAFDQAAACARKALAQNPRSSQAWRILAASLAMMGDCRGAREALGEAIAIEPQLTLVRLRARLAFMPERLWATLAEGLRRAGLEE